MEDIGEAIRDITNGRGTDSVIDAVGMEAHGSPGSKFAQTVSGYLPEYRTRTTLWHTAGLELMPLEDPEGVNERRAAVGALPWARCRGNGFC